MTTKPYTTKLKRDAIEGLHNVIETLLQTKPETDDDKLLFAALAEIKHRLYVKLDTYQTNYQVSFTPTQAFALRLLGTDYVTDRKTYLGNIIHTIAKEVHQKYS